MFFFKIHKIDYGENLAILANCNYLTGSYLSPPTFSLDMEEEKHLKEDFEDSYNLLIKQIDKFAIDYMLVQSYWNHSAEDKSNPYPNKSSLKPGSKSKNMREKKAILQNHGLIICYKSALHNGLKDIIRLRRKYRVNKGNLNYFIDEDPENKEIIDFVNEFKHSHTNISDPRFNGVLEHLLETDYGLVIQNDSKTIDHAKYSLTHHRVKVDYSVNDAATSLAKRLGYIHENLRERENQIGEEKAEQFSETMEENLFEYYGFHHDVGGRRTAAVTGSELNRSQGCESVVYVG